MVSEISLQSARQPSHCCPSCLPEHTGTILAAAPGPARPQAPKPWHSWWGSRGDHRSSHTFGSGWHPPSSSGCKACAQVLDCYLVGSVCCRHRPTVPFLHTPPTLVHKCTCSCVEWKGVGSVLCFILGVLNQSCKRGLPLVTFSQIKSHSRLLSATANT